MSRCVGEDGFSKHALLLLCSFFSLSAVSKVKDLSFLAGDEEGWRSAKGEGQRKDTWRGEQEPDNRPL